MAVLRVKRIHAILCAAKELRMAFCNIIALLEFWN